MCQTLGGTVKEGVEGEYGRAELEVTGSIDHLKCLTLTYRPSQPPWLQVNATSTSPIFNGISAKSTVWMSHRDEASVQGTSVSGTREPVPQ